MATQTASLGGRAASAPVSLRRSSAGIWAGISPPTLSWGNMLTRVTQDLARGPWLVYAPGAAIFLTVLCLDLLGDGLRDALDPRLNTSVG